MVANPNSNLVFDFPDPTPQFAFDGNGGGGPSSSSNSPVKKGKRFGLGTKGSKFGSNKSKVLGLGSSSSPAKDSVGSTTANTSLNSSLNSSLGGSSPSKTARLGGSSPLKPRNPSPLKSSSRNNPSPLKPRSHSGDIAGGPSHGNGSSVAGSHASSSIAAHSQGTSLNFSFDSGAPSSSAKLHLPSKGGAAAPSGQGGHARHPSSANSASGYVSEVSEFSFDRVTVTTNETGVTGQSSNVSWGFLDETVGAVGGGQKGGSPNGNNGSNKKMFVPYTGDTPVEERTTIKGKGHAPKASVDTFDNVSLSDEENDIPFSGVVNDSNQSVISEMSERTGGQNDRPGGGDRANDAVKALLREGMESARARHRQEQGTPAGVVTKDVPKGSESPSRDTQTTAKSSTDNDDTQGGKATLLGDLQSKYTSFKTSRNGGAKENKTSILQGVLEDVQFCGLYFCGIDTTNDKEMTFEDDMKRKKMDRKQGADDTFLGRVIQCGSDYGCHGGNAFCAAL